MKLTVTRTAVTATDNLGRPYAMLFRHFYDAETGMKRGCKGKIISCKTAEEAAGVVKLHRETGIPFQPTKH